MVKKQNKTCLYDNGFSLTELLAAMVISTLVLVASLGVFGQMRRSTTRINQRIDENQLPNEILQRIAEDLDKVKTPVLSNVADTKITIRNKLDNLFQSAQLKIVRTVYNNKNTAQTFEEIIWQSNYDFDTDSLILYRSHKGLTIEDRILGQEKEQWKRELFIPVASGLTLFKIDVPKEDDEFVESWDSDKLPVGVRISLSFVQPFEAVDGKFDVLEDEMVVRMVTIDRSRNIKFEYDAPDFNELEVEEFYPNGENYSGPNDLSNEEFDDEYENERITQPTERTRR